MQANELCEKLLELLKQADQAIVIVKEQSQLNLRFASNTLTTNGDIQNFQVHVIPFFQGSDGVHTATTSRALVGELELPELARSALASAQAASADPEAMALATDFQVGDWSAPHPVTTARAFSELAPALQSEFDWASSAAIELFGYAEQTMTTTWLASSTGLRLRWDQPDGRLELTAKSHARTRSTWEGIHTVDFSTLDFSEIRAAVVQKLAWQERTIELPVGNYEVVAPPGVVADLFTYLMWEAGAKSAHDERSAFAGLTLPGAQLSNQLINFYSDPSARGIECANFFIAPTSTAISSIFDNGQRLSRVDWIKGGKLTSLINTKFQAQQFDQTFSPFGDNLVIDSSGIKTSLPQQIANVSDGLLLNTLWYIRMVDPSALLLTGLTRDGVYQIKHGEIVGAVRNYRWNVSPLTLLNQITAVSESEIAQPREWADDIFRIKAPAMTFTGFNMSTQSPAN